MEEQTIVISDLLSFTWCKLNLCTVTKENLLKCVQDFYSKKDALEALKILLTVLPDEIPNIHRKTLDSNPFKAILDILERSSREQLPIFVCKNLNNVPNIKSVNEKPLVDKETVVPVAEKNALYKEHQKIKSELGELCGSLYELKRQLRVMTDHNKSDDGETKRRKSHVTNSARSTPKDFITIQKIKVEEVDDDDDASDSLDEGGKREANNLRDPDSDDSTNCEYDAEQRGLLIANRYQRALARCAEKGEKDLQFLNFDSLAKQFPITVPRRPRTILTVSRGTSKASSKNNAINNGGTAETVYESPVETTKVKKGQNSLHQCSSCSFSTEDGAAARAHTCFKDTDGKNVHPSEGNADTKSYSCNDCDINFKTVDALNIHKMSHFETDFRCPLCSNRLSEQDWVNHVRSCPGDGTTNREDHLCTVCDVYFADKKILGYHLAYHDNSRPFECLECRYRFYTQKAVEDHFKMHSGSDHRHKCPFCNLRTPKLNRIKEHIRGHTGDKPFTCHLCDYATTTYDTLKGHQRSHSQNREFKCNQCEKLYKTKNKLRFHQRVHTKEKPHKCPVCGRGFNYGMCMTLHYRRHLGERTHDCPECEFKGSTGNELRKHMTTNHTNKLPYRCTKCDFGAKFKSYLVAHRKKEHPKRSH